MNKTITDFTRTQIKEGLSQLPSKWVHKFKQIYSHNDLNADINNVVDNLPSDKLDWALTQVENSLLKLKKED